MNRRSRRVFALLSLSILAGCRRPAVDAAADRVLRYDRPAQSWNEALPVGNGRLGAMVFGGVPRERIQFNEETLWTGGPHDYSHPGATEYLGKIREFLFAGKPREAEALAMERFMSVPLGQMAYQTFGDLAIDLPGHERFTDYGRSLDIGRAVSGVTYKVNARPSPGRCSPATPTRSSSSSRSRTAPTSRSGHRPVTRGFRTTRYERV